MTEALDWLTVRPCRRAEHTAVSGVSITLPATPQLALAAWMWATRWRRTVHYAGSFHYAAIAHVDHVIGLGADLLRMRHQDDRLASRLVHLSQQVHDLL